MWEQVEYLCRTNTCIGDHDHFEEVLAFVCGKFKKMRLCLEAQGIGKSRGAYIPRPTYLETSEEVLAIIKIMRLPKSHVDISWLVLGNLIETIRKVLSRDLPEMSWRDRSCISPDGRTSARRQGVFVFLLITTHRTPSKKQFFATLKLRRYVARLYGPMDRIVDSGKRLLCNRRVRPLSRTSLG